MARRPVTTRVDRPAHQRLDRPREVVVQRGDGHVRAGVRVVDRVDLVAGHEHLAGVELPVEEGVHDPADRRRLVAGRLGQEAVGHGVPVVHRLVRPEVHHHRLRADGQRPGEVLVVDGGLEVHQHLAGLVVRAVQVAAVVDPGDPAPAAAVERLHVQRVAELLGEVVEVERLVVLLRRVGPADVVDRVLVRHQRGRRDLEAEPDHRAVGAVLLHRLERERAVEQVGPVDQRRLLQPLARVVVPVRQPVDHQLGADRVARGRTARW